MKKMYLLLCLLPFAVSMSAQKLDGTWMADKEFKEVFELDDEETSMDMFLNFKEEKMTIAFHIMSEDSDVGTIGMVVGIPGTYDVTEDEVTATFDKEATELKITTLNLLDPELNQLMSADEESRKAIVSMIESQVRSMNDSDLASIGAMSDYFRDFKIFSLTNEKLVIQIGDMKFGFDNVE